MMWEVMTKMKKELSEQAGVSGFIGYELIIGGWQSITRTDRNKAVGQEIQSWNGWEES